MSRQLQDRDVWQDMANDPNETEQNRAEAQEEVDKINQQLQDNGYDENQYDDDHNFILGPNAGAGIGADGGEDNANSSIFDRARRKIQEPGAARLATKIGIKGAKTLGKGALFAGRGLVRATGMIGGATVGLAAGLTTGDMSKALSFAAAGATAGNVIGKNINNMTGRAFRGVRNAPRNVKNKVGQLQDSWNENLHGSKVAREKRMERQNKDARKQLLKASNTEEREKVRDWMGKVGYSGSEESVLNAKADLLEAGVRDDLIDDVLKTEFTETGSLSGSNHSQYVDAAGFISKYGYNKDSIEDEEKMARMEERVQSMVSNPNDQLAVMQMTSKMLGADKMYERRRRAGQTRIGNTSQQGTRTNTGTRGTGSGGNGSGSNGSGGTGSGGNGSGGTGSGGNGSGGTGSGG